MKKLLILLAGFLIVIQLSGQNTGTWGDQGNGTFINPVLNADYSDPDVIRVDSRYYMVCSEFHFMGMPVLESDAENNGKIISENAFKGKKIYLKVSFDIRGNNNQFFYSTDNTRFTPIGETFITTAGFWKGSRPGLYSYNEKTDGGVAAFNWFRYEYDGPKGR